MSEFRLRRGRWGDWKIQKKGYIFWTTVATWYASLEGAVEILDWYQATEGKPA